MLTRERRPLAEALAEAQRFRSLFDGTYERWEIAGSVRRKRRDVGDVEHVVLPKIQMVDVASGLFGTEQAPLNLVHNRLERLLDEGTITKHLYSDGKHKWGDFWRGVDFNGYRHEVFLGSPKGDNFGPLLAIRTGPAAFSQLLVTRIAQAGTLRQEDGFVKYVSGPLAGTILPCVSEEQYFNLCGVPWCPPEKRDMIANPRFPD